MSVTIESGRAVIRCTYHGPTDKRGTRISVRRFDSPSVGRDPNRAFVPWAYALSPSENYVAAVQAYIMRAGWSGTWAVSTCDDGAVAVYVPGSDSTVAR